MTSFQDEVERLLNISRGILHSKVEEIEKRTENAADIIKSKRGQGHVRQDLMNHIFNCISDAGTEVKDFVAEATQQFEQGVQSFCHSKKKKSRRKQFGQKPNEEAIREAIKHRLYLIGQVIGCLLTTEAEDYVEAATPDKSSDLHDALNEVINDPDERHEVREMVTLLMLHIRSQVFEQIFEASNRKVEIFEGERLLQDLADVVFSQEDDSDDDDEEEEDEDKENEDPSGQDGDQEPAEGGGQSPFSLRMLVKDSYTNGR